jgi:putative membrane protein
MMRILWLANGILLQGQGPGPYQGPWGWHYGMMGGGWGMIFMIIAMILFWGLIIGGIILLVRFIFPSVSSGMKPSQDALEILKQRYAKGEIEKEEFDSKKRDLLS